MFRFIELINNRRALANVRLYNNSRKINKSFVKYLTLLFLININLFSSTAIPDDNPNNHCGSNYTAYYVDTTNFKNIYDGVVGNFVNLGISYSRPDTDPLGSFYINEFSPIFQNVEYNADATYKKYSIYYVEMSNKEYGGALHSLTGTSENYVCEVKADYMCDDGGMSLNGNCDRTCEQVGMIGFQDFYSGDVIIDENGNSNYVRYKCYPNIDSSIVLESCINYCTNGGYYDGIPASETNVENCIYNIDTVNGGFTDEPVCVCKTDPTDLGGGSDDGGSTGGTDGGSDGSTVDMTATNQKLDSIKSNTNTTNTKLEDIKTKIDSTNTKLDTSNDWLSKVDTVLRDIFSTNEDIKDNTNSTNNKLDILINDNDSITNFLSNINDSVSSLFNDITGFRSDVNSKLDTNNQKLQEIKNNSDLLNTNVGYIAETGEHINQNVLGVKDAVGSVEVAINDVNGTIESQKTILEESNTLQSDTNDKLDTSNSLLTDNNSKLDGINNSINDTNSKLDGLNTDLNDGLGDVNEHLTNIEDSNQGILDKITDMFEDSNETFNTDDVDNAINTSNETDEETKGALENYISDLTGVYDNAVTQIEQIKQIGDNGFTFNVSSSNVSTCGATVKGVDLLSNFFDLLAPIKPFISLFIQIVLMYIGIKIYIFTISMLVRSF